MATVTFAPGTPSSFSAVILGADALGGSVNLVTFNTTTIIFQSGLTVYTLSGSNFTFGFVGGSPAVTGGTVAGLAVVTNGAPGMTITDLGISAVVLQAAIIAEGSGADVTALEDLFLPLGWTYTGNANADILLATAVSGDGVPLNLAGNDAFSGNGGNDNFFLGNGNDTGRGGIGADKLYGGIGNDRLFGDAGADRLFGGAGKDQITGGTGDDTMGGGGGADRFIFANGAGSDTITDFDLATDRLDVALPGSVSFMASGADLMVHYGPGADVILLVGVNIGQSGLIDIV